MQQIGIADAVGEILRQAVVDGRAAKQRDRSHGGVSRLLDRRGAHHPKAKRFLLVVSTSQKLIGQHGVAQCDERQKAFFLDAIRVSTCRFLQLCVGARPITLTNLDRDFLQVVVGFFLKDTGPHKKSPFR